LDGEHLKTFLDHVSKQNAYTQQGLADYASKLTVKSITRFIISRTLKTNEFTRKRLSHHYLEQDEEKINEFQSTLHPLLDLPILALDESSFPLNLAPRFGYSKKGLRANFNKTGKRGASYTLIFCIANVKEEGVVL
jgi:hypothetical protein